VHPADGHWPHAEAKLEAKYQQIQGMQTSYEANLNKLWTEYEVGSHSSSRPDARLQDSRVLADSAAAADTLQDLYNQIDGVKQEALATIDKQKSLLKRKASSLQKDCNDRLADAEGKIAKLKTQAGKIPDLGSFIKALM
jgi:chromosome segregation ATPase